MKHLTADMVASIYENAPAILDNLKDENMEVYFCIVADRFLLEVVILDF